MGGKGVRGLRGWWAGVPSCLSVLGIAEALARRVSGECGGDEEGFELCLLAGVV